MSFRNTYQRKLFTLAISLLYATIVIAQHPVAEKGVMDLRHYSFESHNPLDLKGEWNFTGSNYFLIKRKFLIRNKHLCGCRNCGMGSSGRVNH